MKKIPNYILKLNKKRTKLAHELMDIDQKLLDFLEKEKIVYYKQIDLNGYVNNVNSYTLLTEPEYCEEQYIELLNNIINSKSR